MVLQFHIQIKVISDVIQMRKKRSWYDWLITYETIQSRDERCHPAIFPIKLPFYCIKLHGYDSNTIVYDPFMGIGTTAAACIDLRVNYLGTEINKDYVQLAESTIDERNKLKNDYKKQISLENYL